MSAIIRIGNGSLINLEALNPTMFRLPEIAKSLSKICRFTGHTSDFYSVAEHSVMVSRLAAKLGGDPLAGLLHDASEAFLGDVSKPLKALLPHYKTLESRMMAVVFQKFGGLKMDENVHLADRIACQVEGKKLVKDWECDFPVNPGFEFQIDCLMPNEAERLFSEEFYMLQQKALTNTAKS